MAIDDTKESLEAVLHMVDCCFVLHNLLLSFSDEINDRWLDDEEDVVSDIGEAIGEDELFMAIPEGEAKDTRRSNLMDFCKQYVF